MKLIIVLSFLFTIALYSCGSTEKPGQAVSDPESATAEVLEVEESDNQELSEDTYPDDEIREYGRILGIEDSGYPMYIITMEFPERGIKQDFNFNAEAGIMDLQELMEAQGQYASVFYTSELEHFIYDIHYEGKTILGEYAPESVDDLKAITGRLSGAENTAGDLPIEITITPENGEAVLFEYFVTEDEVGLNGQTVSVYYDTRGTTTITRIEISED